MKSAQLGTATSAVEVTNISVHGLWLFIHEQEIFLPYERFPWFQDAPVRNIVHVKMPSPQHLYWPDLDVDLELDSILHPENYPLTSKIQKIKTRKFAKKNCCTTPGTNKNIRD